MTGWALIRETLGILLGAAAMLVACVVFFYWPRSASSPAAFRVAMTRARLNVLGWILLFGILALWLFGCRGAEARSDLSSRRVAACAASLLFSR